MDFKKILHCHPDGQVVHVSAANELALRMRDSAATAQRGALDLRDDAKEALVDEPLDLGPAGPPLVLGWKPKDNTISELATTPTSCATADREPRCHLSFGAYDDSFTAMPDETASMAYAMIPRASSEGREGRWNPLPTYPEYDIQQTIKRRIAVGSNYRDTALARPHLGVPQTASVGPNFRVLRGPTPVDDPYDYRRIPGPTNTKIYQIPNGKAFGVLKLSDGPKSSFDISEQRARRPNGWNQTGERGYWQAGSSALSEPNVGLGHRQPSDTPSTSSYPTPTSPRTPVDTAMDYMDIEQTPRAGKFSMVDEFGIERRAIAGGAFSEMDYSPMTSPPESAPTSPRSQSSSVSTSAANAPSASSTTPKTKRQNKGKRKRKNRGNFTNVSERQAAFQGDHWIAASPGNYAECRACGKRVKTDDRRSDTQYYSTLWEKHRAKCKHIVLRYTVHCWVHRNEPGTWPPPEDNYWNEIHPGMPAFPTHSTPNRPLPRWLELGRGAARSGYNLRWRGMTAHWNDELVNIENVFVRGRYSPTWNNGTVGIGTEQSGLGNDQDLDGDESNEHDD